MRLMPRIRVVAELPQWIIASDIAAYTTVTCTIWIRRAPRASMAVSLGHELVHHIIHILGGGRRLHLAYDRVWVRIFRRPLDFSEPDV